MSIISKEVRAPKIWEALLTFGMLIAVMAIGISVYKADPHLPMLFGSVFAALMSLRLGYKWEQIEKSMYKGIYSALQAVVILLIIGVLIGVWIVAGVVPSMIYFGLQILSPRFFLVAAIIITSITSLATGTSWGSAGTIGIALMGIAVGLGIPAPVSAGAIVSGAYFGDKLSPLSDTTNLAPAMAGTDVFTHIKFMMKPTVITYVIVLIIYTILGFRYAGSNVDVTAVQTISEGINQSFSISPFLLIPPVVVIGAIALKVPAIPGIIIGIFLGGLFGLGFQDINFGNLLESGYGGFVSESGIEAIDELLSSGGLTSMMYSVSLTILAMMFGGIMETTGQLDVIVAKLLKVVKGTTQLVTLTMATSLVSNMTMPEQFISIVVPGKMYAKTYKEKGLHPKMLSNALESCGTLSGALIPWNTCGVFLTSVLGVATIQYAPYAFFNYLMPIVVIILTAANQLTVLRTDDPSTIIDTDN